VDGSSRIGQAARLLDERGRDVGRLRVAAGRSGVVVAFPRDPMVHVSWLVLAAMTGLAVAIKLRRARATRPRPRTQG
jgi:hypothetical protein